jgi:putative nucleotidyltransferase with HDIG domain
MTLETKINVIEELFNFFQESGFEEYVGEKVSQLEHALQTAKLAEEENYEDEVVLAALFHDIGHLMKFENEDAKMGNFGTKNHEHIGAQYLLDNGFSKKMYELVIGHVRTKKYLVYKFPDYKATLSEASLKTLEYQGGAMTEIEASTFEKDEFFHLHLKMREWDDKAKIPGLKTKSLTDYKTKALELLL